jgi:hypothetical protein
MSFTPQQRADERLYEWARWSRGGDWIGLPSVTVLGRVMEQGVLGAGQSGRPTMDIPEHIAEVDRAVSQLAEPLRNVCKAQYLTRGDLPVKARRLKISRNSFKSRLEIARRRVAVWLNL